MKIAERTAAITSNHSDYVRLIVIVVYFLVVGILAAYAFSPIGGEMGYILARLIPHLFYIPLVLTALWYPKKKLAHITIFSIIFLTLISGFLLKGWSLDAIFTVFTSFIYLWVFIAILAIPQVQIGTKMREGTAERAGAELNSTGVVPGVKFPDTELPEGVLSRMPVIPPTQITPLIESFRLGEELVTRNTSAALKAIGRPSIPYIIAGLKSDSIPVRENCARLLGEMDNSESVDLLVETMADSSRRVHNSATQALARIGEPAVPSLLSALNNEKWKIRAGAVVALRIIGLNESMPILIDMRTDKSHYVRKEVAKSLSRMGKDEVIGLLMDMLDDESRGVRLAAVGGLGRSGRQEAIEPLKKILDEEEDAEVRIRAVHSLELIGTATAYEAMKEALDDTDPEVSASAEEILRRNYKV